MVCQRKFKNVNSLKVNNFLLEKLKVQLHSIYLLTFAMGLIRFFSPVMYWIFSVCLLHNDCRQLDGYKFPVNTTPFCPRNETEWNERSFAMNCTESNGYTCLPNQDLTELLEFCYIYPFIWIQDGVCLYLLKGVSRVNAYDCHHFHHGCHNSSFPSNKIFEPHKPQLICQKLQKMFKKIITFPTTKIIGSGLLLCWELLS